MHKQVLLIYTSYILKDFVVLTIFNTTKDSNKQSLLQSNIVEFCYNQVIESPIPTTTHTVRKALSVQKQKINVNRRADGRLSRMCDEKCQTRVGVSVGGVDVLLCDSESEEVP